MKKMNKSPLLLISLGIIIGIVLTLIFQVATSGNANKSLNKKMTIENLPTYKDAATVQRCLDEGGTASSGSGVINPDNGNIGSYVSCSTGWVEWDYS